MRKITKILVIVGILLFSLAPISGCSCSCGESELALLRYYAANIGGFDSLALGTATTAQDITSSSVGSSNQESSDKVKLYVKHKGSQDYDDAKFIVRDDKKGKLKGFDGERLRVGDEFFQHELPFWVDKLCVMYDYTFISFVMDESEYQRPNKALVEWSSDPAHPTYKYGNEYDFEGYCSNDKRASFVMDNRNGQLYYINRGVTVDIADLGFIEGQILSFGTDHRVSVVEPKYEVSDYKAVVRDAKGNNFVPSNINYCDYKAKVVYYNSKYEECKDYFVRTNVGDVVHIKFSSNRRASGIAGEESVIEYIALVNEDLSETPLGKDFSADADNDLFHKYHVGGDFVNRIENGYVYVSSGFGKILMNRFAFVEGNEDKSVYLDADYIYENNSPENYKYVTLWDYDTVLVETNMVNGEQGYYYSNVFEDGEYDGSDETIGGLHLIMNNCDSIDVHYNGLAYLAEKTRTQGVLVKDDVTYALIEDPETNVITAVPKTENNE